MRNIYFRKYQWRKEVELTRKQVVMANERTFNSWIRTGLTAVVGGLFIARFIGESQKSPIVTLIGLIFVISSIGFLPPDTGVLDKTYIE